MTNGKYMLAVIPPSLASVESGFGATTNHEQCTLVTWSMEDGKFCKTRMDLDIDMEESGSGSSLVYSSRALFTSCYDGANNIIWSFQPFR